MSDKIIKCILISLLILSFSISCQNEGLKWQGTIETIGGVTIINNPEEPMYSDTFLSLEEEVLIQDDEEEGGLIFSMLASIDVDGIGKIYVADQQGGQIHIFDSAGAHILSFGERGQGPGEMALPFSISITPWNEIMVNDWMLRRVSFYSSDGKFIRQATSASLLFLRTKADSHGNLIGSYFIPGKSPKVKLEKFSAKLESLLTMDTASMPPMPEMTVFIPHFFWKIIEEDNILWGTIAEYEFSLADAEGNVKKKIRKNYSPVKTTKEAKESWQEEINWDYIPPFADAQVKTPEVYPPFLSFGVDDYGRLIVRTFEKDREGNILYDIFDDQGRYIAKTSLKIPPLEPRRHVWKNNRLYTIEADEDGFQVIKVYRAIWDRF